MWFVNDGFKMWSSQKTEEQKITITESVKQDLIKEANATIESPNSTFLEKAQAKQTLRKFEQLEESAKKAMAEAGKPRQIGAGQVNHIRKFHSTEDFSALFYEDESQAVEKTDEFWNIPTVLKMKNVRIRTAVCTDTNILYIYMRKENSKYSPTIIKMSLIEGEEFIKKCIALQAEVKETDPGTIIPWLNNEFGAINNPQHNDFWDASVCVATKSGSVKMRPFKSADGSLLFKFISPRPPSNYEWKGPSMSLNYKQFAGFINFVRYSVENSQNNI